MEIKLLSSAVPLPVWVEQRPFVGCRSDSYVSWKTLREIGGGSIERLNGSSFEIPSDETNLEVRNLRQNVLVHTGRAEKPVDK